MAKNNRSDLLAGEIFEDDGDLSFADLCRLCRVPAEHVLQLVDEGIAEPVGSDAAQWRFRRVNVKRVRCALHLKRDLGVNTAGAALALDLLDELDRLRARLHRLGG
jgi:chaperone modulatory protein CbpM